MRDLTLDDLVQARMTVGTAPVALAFARNGVVVERMSPTSLSAAVARAAAGLAGLGLEAGSGIALWLPNLPEWTILHLAAARIGARTLPLNTWLRASEVAHLLRTLPCDAVAIAGDYRDIAFETMLDEVRAELRATGDAVPGWTITVGRPDVPARDACTIDLVNLPAGDAISACASDAIVIGFPTSGTTSLPKLALHDQAGLARHACAVAARAEMTSADVVLCALPPCGAYGYGMILAALASGATAILCEEFDLDAVVALIAAEAVTMLAVTEPLLRRLLDHPLATPENFASLRLVFSAGATLEPLVRRAEAELGFRVTNVYGSSEALALTAFWDRSADIATRAAAGGALTNAEMWVRARDPDGRVLPPGEAGELQFRGATLSRGYAGAAGIDRSAFTPDGWSCSGDLGVVLDDAGTRFHYVARMNDTLRLRGFLVNPGEIEATLQAYPAVAAAQVIGVPMDGEDRAVGFVVAHDGVAVDEAALATFCRARMASYKVPHRIGVLDAFPLTRSANGDKVLKSRLRTLAKDMFIDG